MVKDPEVGDFVTIAGRITAIEEGVALVEVYRGWPVGVNVPVQCGALEHLEQPKREVEEAFQPVRADY
ncbi:MAG TPA: hypothetical protein VGR71_16960 [Nitrospira sp.]|nr:hypothetical protein [Nitrospira sp.]